MAADPGPIDHQTLHPEHTPPADGPRSGCSATGPRRAIPASGRDLTGLEPSGCRLTSVSLDDTDLTGARLVETRLEEIDVPHVSIGERDLVDATVARMAFEDCTVTTLDVHPAALSGADLRGLDLGTIHHLDGLRGCTIDGEQALGLTRHFAAHLGIVID
ncbi:pentapeptide repeat-containing protein [Gordonia oryzae]|uniref:Pentapeptide repeat-containing protein n=1 Tax=Gordonia oryzae TaxID=2487349 RepID=A0A3N4GVL0_9ACTN|nr:pentapeptide repeat-containing protein [Gordonia oryzae]